MTGATGTIIVVVGPSGAGKDSVIDIALSHLAADRHAVHLVRRAITRRHDAGGEDHESLSAAEFQERLAANGFAVSWAAHGLHYGIPADALARVAKGQTLICNGSRAALDRFRQVFPRVVVVNIVASPEVLARRLVSRGRESEADILKRLQRRTPDLVEEPDVVTIDNSGPLHVAGLQFVGLVRSVCAVRSETDAL